MEARFGTAPKLKIDGEWLEGEVAALHLRTTITEDINGPGTCDVVFSDADRSVLEQLGADFGLELEVHASAVEDRAEHPVFVGVIYGLEFQADESGCVSMLRCYDATYALRQHRAIQSFNDVTDADLVRSLCGEAGVAVGDLEDGDTNHSYVAQLNESHWDFLRDRAAAAGTHLFAADGKVHFKPVGSAADAPDPGDHESTDPLQLTPGLNLLYLRARQSAAQQIEEVEVRGWNPTEKVEVVARERVETQAVRTGCAPGPTAAEHGSPLQVVGRPVLTEEGRCRSVARSMSERLATAFAFIEGKAYGDPRLRAGTAVALGRTGRFDGRYTLTSVRHVFDQDGFFSYVTVTGEHDRSLYGLVGARSTRPAIASDGMVPAIVTNINDPDKLGRVKVRFPWLSDDFESNWSRVVQIGAGKERGLLLFPEVEDEVLVTFIGGDVSHPVIMGGLYNGVDVPPAEGYEDLTDGTVDVRGLKSRAGHAILMTDKGGSETITIQTSDQSVTLTFDQADGGAVVLDANGDVTVTAGGAVTVEAGADLTGKAGGNIQLESSGQMNLKAAANLSIEAGGAVEIKGAVVNLN